MTLALLATWKGAIFVVLTQEYLLMAERQNTDAVSVTYLHLELTRGFAGGRAERG